MGSWVAVSTVNWADTTCYSEWKLLFLHRQAFDNQTIQKAFLRSEPIPGDTDGFGGGFGGGLGAANTAAGADPLRSEITEIRGLPHVSTLG